MSGVGGDLLASGPRPGEEEGVWKRDMCDDGGPGDFRSGGGGGGGGRGGEGGWRRDEYRRSDSNYRGGDRGYGGDRGRDGSNYNRRNYRDGGRYGRGDVCRRVDSGRGGASHLARIHGTEDDRVNCPFYFKIGACRHGDACSRAHNKPAFSQTIMIPGMYIESAGRSPKDRENHFMDFYEDVWLELASCGELEEIIVSENVCEHLAGNVYARFCDEEDAAKALSKLYGRFYDRRQLTAEFSPVADFRVARCRSHDEGHCSRGGYCNFLHSKKIDRYFMDELYYEQDHFGERSKKRGGRYRGR